MSGLTSALWKFKGQAKHLIVANSPAILTAIGISGVVSTAYLSGKASYEAAGIIRKAEMGGDPPPEDPLERLKSRVPLVWKLYIPAASSGAVTIGCMVMATRIGSRRTAAVAAAYSLSERAFTEYKEKVAETHGQNKEAKLRESLHQDTVNNRPPTQQLVMLSAAGNVLCHDQFAGRYFHADMEKLRGAQNKTNDKIIREGEASMNDFYSYFDAWCADWASKMGWSQKLGLLELQIIPVLYENIPILSIEYNYIEPI